jgi:asparagine synthase (glutamine-hydrolysing)
MCGFSGLITANHTHPEAQGWKNHFAEAARKISHRGTDDARMVSFSSVSLHHFRLAFQDLEAGRQPMMSGDGKFAITFNGEIYNHHELREQLASTHGNIAWRTTSDTETILQGWLLEGDAFANKLEGEFAFVIVRTDGGEFFAARDHFGVKPLFFALADVNTRLFSDARTHYFVESGLVAFASEMKALPGKKVWNRDGALRQFVGLFEPICTPFENIIQCPPGGRIRGSKIVAGEMQTQMKIQVHTRNHPIRKSSKGEFWSGQNVTKQLAEFRSAFSQSVNERLLSDVELGVYQSGGIDSKAVAFELSRVLKQHSSAWLKDSLKSFTVGFESAGYDESQEAIEFSRFLGFQPHVLKLSSEALQYSYPHAVYISENLQPFTNGAAKWWLSLFARRYTPGVLTGDGADELLCGYPSFRYCAWWAFAQRGRRENQGPGQRWRDSVFVKKFSEQTRDPWLSGSSAEGRGDDFESSLALWQVPHPLFNQIFTITECLLGRQEAALWLSSQGPSIRSWYLLGIDDNAHEVSFTTHPENALLLWQNYFCHTHLPVQILNWVGDRMEMANTLEGRTPFLSGKMRRFVANLPDVALVQGFLDKAILRKAYASELPHRFTMTPKKQFNAPFLNSDVLFNEFDTAHVLSKMGIVSNGVDVANRLLNTSKEQDSSKISASDRYLSTHRMSALQTLLCSSIVQRTLVESQPMPRNHEFESQIVAQGGPLP